jgi:hypothetical protein
MTVLMKSSLVLTTGQLIMQSLPDEAKDILYQNNIRNPDEDVRGTIARSQDFPEAVKWRIHPQSIFEQYGRSDQTSILHLIAIHVMVRDIEQQNWLNFAQKTRLRVLTGQLFDLLHYKGNDLGTEEFNNLCRAYGPMRWDPRRAVWEYRNVLRQCYFSEYVERASKWDSIPKDPSASWTEIRQYLMSDEYLEHVSSWLQRLHVWLLIKYSVAPYDHRFRGKSAGSIPQEQHGDSGGQALLLAVSGADW